MESNRKESVSVLHEYLAHDAPGEIVDTGNVERLLALAWDDLLRDDGGMRPDKLFGRMERVVWKPPLLTFSIERHGATVMGSSRAEMQEWTVDVERATASCEKTGYRQLMPRQPPLNVRPLAEEITALILRHADDARIKWQDEETVLVKTGLILPKDSAVKETLAYRRKRLRVALAERLATHGWVQVSANKYQLKGIL